MFEFVYCFLICAVELVPSSQDSKYTVKCDSLFRRAVISFVVSVRPSVRMQQLGYHWIDVCEISCLRIFFENLSRKFKFHESLTRITATVNGQ